ncbi:hypothetical protein Pmar_PMAR016004, partial [Perkinsus marinus ATCC 50983]
KGGGMSVRHKGGGGSQRNVDTANYRHYQQGNAQVTGAMYGNSTDQQQQVQGGYSCEDTADVSSSGNTGESDPSGPTTAAAAAANVYWQQNYYAAMAAAAAA